MKNHAFFIQKCITLAKNGIGSVSPNPMVGAVIVYKNKIIGEGYHEKFGSNHAEVNAINSVKNKSLLSNSTLYVNLEPCSHFGKTSPCSDLIIQKKIPKVVIGCIDTYCEVAGSGIERMRNAGIDVQVGIMNLESRELNKRFFSFHEKKRPYIILKWAESKDRFIAPKNQKEPFWMTSNKSKKLVHQWRSEEDSILIGRVTAKIDNPFLTVREVKGRNPIRILLDKNLTLSKNINLLNSEAKTIIFNQIKSEEISHQKYIKIDFNKLIENILVELYKLDIQSLIIEGGAKTIQSFINRKLWDEARIFTTKLKMKNGVKAPLINGNILSTKVIDNDSLKIMAND